MQRRSVVTRGMWTSCRSARDLETAYCVWANGSHVARMECLQRHRAFGGDEGGVAV